MDYKIYQSKYIIEHQSEIVKQCHKVKENYNGPIAIKNVVCFITTNVVF